METQFTGRYRTYVSSQVSSTLNFKMPDLAPYFGFRKISRRVASTVWYSTSEMKVSIQRLPILSYRREPDNPRLKTDAENARFKARFLRHVLAAWRWAGQDAVGAH